jgi:hypothetical protein
MEVQIGYRSAHRVLRQMTYKPVCFRGRDHRQNDGIGLARREGQHSWPYPADGRMYRRSGVLDRAQGRPYNDERLAQDSLSADAQYNSAAI